MARNVFESYVCKENKFVDIFFFLKIFLFSLLIGRKNKHKAKKNLTNIITHRRCKPGSTKPDQRSGRQEELRPSSCFDFCPSFWIVFTPVNKQQGSDFFSLYVVVLNIISAFDSGKFLNNPLLVCKSRPG